MIRRMMAEVVSQLALVLSEEQFAERAQLSYAMLMTTVKGGRRLCYQRITLSTSLSRLRVGHTSFINTFHVSIYTVDPRRAAFYVRLLAISTTE